ncbi:discoidin domain-containing protein [Streptomyces sp. N2-109]|uniref:Discoidin domain-containing protein n=1 Tax=Streptomyces gossypii TaxID=2883101 RepID=A0ABT2K383_9ACTN|nr:discoidin domain-containing protein [Streptomyces gossypii]MCT2593934.1 discoidin domain-containing protein [Streptomyces gossypii]
MPPPRSPSAPPPPAAPPPPHGPPPAATAPLPPEQRPAAPRRPGDAPDEHGPGPDHRPDGTDTPPAAPHRAVVSPHVGRPPCSRCGTDNTHDRRLCRSCGTLLDTPLPSPVPTRLPWWRRLFGRSDRPLAAGSRPRHRIWRRPHLALPLLLLILVAAVWFGRDRLPEALDFAKDTTSKPEALRPQEVRASSQAPRHGPGKAFDGFNNRYWAPSEAGPGDGEYLEADFAKPVRLRKVLITPGRSVNQDEFLTQTRPSRITVTLVNGDGESRTRTLRLKDQSGQQTFNVPGSDVVRVRLTTEAAFGVRPDRRLAVAEVEFFGRR